MSEAQKLAEMNRQAQQELQNRLKNQMRDIEEAIKERSMTEVARLRKTLKEQKVGEREIEQRVFELKAKEFSSNFKSYSRDRRDEIFSNKTNPPAVGTYHPIRDLTEPASLKMTVKGHHIAKE